MSTVTVEIATDTNDSVAVTAALSHYLTARISDKPPTDFHTAKYYARISVYEGKKALKLRGYSAKKPFSDGFYFFSGIIEFRNKILLNIPDTEAIIVQVTSFADKRLESMAECLLRGSTASMVLPRYPLKLSCFAGKWSEIDDPLKEIR